MLFRFEHYISLIDRIINNTVLTGTSKYHSLKKFKTGKGQSHVPLFCNFKLIYDPQHISQKYFLGTLTYFELDNSGVNYPVRDGHSVSSE